MIMKSMAIYYWRDECLLTSLILCVLCATCNPQHEQGRNSLDGEATNCSLLASYVGKKLKLELIGRI